MRASASSSHNPTASIVPSPRPHSSMKRARSAIILAASSIEKMPATHAAAISPTLWPTTAEGCTPQDFQSAASATCIAKMAGCPISVRCICGHFLGAAEFFEEREACPGRERSVTSFHRLTKDRLMSINSRPMPHHCGPCPLMMKPMRGGCSRRAAKVVRIFGLSYCSQTCRVPR